MKLNVRYTYDILHHIMEEYYFSVCNGSGDDIANIGSSMAINDKNETIDPATWYDWLEAIDGKKAEVELVKGVMSWYAVKDKSRKNELDNLLLNAEEGYKAAIRFLTKYANMLESREIKEFIQQLTFEKWCAAFEAFSQKECVKLTKEESISS